MHMLDIKTKQTQAERAPPSVGTVGAVPGLPEESAILDIRNKEVRKLDKPNTVDLEHPTKCVGME